MRARVVASFKGSVPRRASHLTPEGEAAVAIDCKLWHGTLESWREPLFRYNAATGTKSVYESLGCCLLSSTTCAHFAEGATETRHVFATGYNGVNYPVRLVLDEECSPTVYRLGLPCPESTPTADTATTTPTKAHQPRQYLYQYKDSFGNRSAASAPSEAVIVAEGQPVIISGWDVPATWDIQTISIYRTVVGFESVIKEGENQLDATWMLVGEVPATATSFTDTKHNDQLWEALIEDVIEPPVASLKGITWIGSMNCLAGYSGRELWFSENNRYHSWPHKLLLDDTIRGIVESNDLIYVVTDGHPYVVTGEVACKDAACRRAIRMPEPIPLAGNGHRSITATVSGAVWPTHNGVAYMRGNAAPIILTNGHYAPDDWQRMHPATARIAYHNGFLYVVCRNGGFILAIKEGATFSTDLDGHTTLSFKPDEMFVTRTGRLLMRFGTEVKEWDRGTAKIPHTWQSGEIIFGVATSFGAAGITMTPGEEEWRISMDGSDVLSETVRSSDHFALPYWATGQSQQFTLTGTATVKRVAIAASTKELL